jgi:hypothetical protein
MVLWSYGGMQGPSIRKRTSTKSIEIINKPVFLFWFFRCCCFGFISKAATTKNRQFIFDLSLLCLGTKITIKTALHTPGKIAICTLKLIKISNKKILHNLLLSSGEPTLFLYFNNGLYRDPASP